MPDYWDQNRGGYAELRECYCGCTYSTDTGRCYHISVSASDVSLRWCAKHKLNLTVRGLGGVCPLCAEENA